MKKSMIGIMILALAMMLAGCADDSTKTQDTGSQDDNDAAMTLPQDDLETDVSADVADESQMDAPEIDVIEQPVLVTEDPKVCVSKLTPQQIINITLSMDEYPLDIDQEGFRFRMMPISADGQVVPVTGSINVQIFMTEYRDDFRGREIEGRAIYNKAFYKKIEEVMPDCGPREVEVKFNDQSWDKNRLLKKKSDDTGIMVVSFIVGNEKYEKRYFPWEHDVISILPQD